MESKKKALMFDTQFLLPIQAHVAPTSFSASAQPLNLHEVFSSCWAENNNAYFGYVCSDTQNTVTIYLATNQTCRYGYTRGGSNYTYNASTQVVNPFTTGDTKRWVVIFDSNSIPAMPNASNFGTIATWIYFSSRVTSYNLVNSSICKYIHFVDLNSWKTIAGTYSNQGGQLTGKMTIPSTVVNFPTAFSNNHSLLTALEIKGATHTGGTTLLSSCGNITEVIVAVGYTATTYYFNQSNILTAVSLNQLILNIADGTKTVTIGTTNKNRLLATYPNAVTNAAARGITVA